MRCIPDVDFGLDHSFRSSCRRHSDQIKKQSSPVKAGNDSGKEEKKDDGKDDGESKGDDGKSGENEKAKECKLRTEIYEGKEEQMKRATEEKTTVMI